jgi:hypothetical protein
MARYIAEAGDPHVDPPPEHVARLRSVLLAHLDSLPAASPGPPRPAWRPKSRLLAGLGAAALLVVLALLALGRQASAWAQVAKALQERPWVHSTMSGPDGKQLVEQWFNMNGETSAERGGTTVSFYDHKRKVFTKYVAADSAIYRLTDAREETTVAYNFLRPVLEMLRDPKGPSKFPFLGMELIGQTRRNIAEGSRKWLDLSLRFAGGPRGLSLLMQIRVDPATKLPASIAMEAEDGNRYTCSIDYPDGGPADIYDLGVPRPAKVIEGTFSDDVRRVLAGLKAGRRDFDDYFAIVVEERLLPINMLPMTTVHRIWRKGLKFRVERLRPKRLDWAPPPDADLTWWNEHQGEFEFVPKLICNGTESWHNPLAGLWKPEMPVAKPGMPNPADQLSGPSQLSRPGDDDLFFLYWAPDVLPEQAGYPPAPIQLRMLPETYRELFVETKATGGPPATILLRGRNTNPISVGNPDSFRLWVDPEANYLAMRSETRVDEAPEHIRSLGPPKVAFIGVHIVEAVEKSPTGHPYPTRSREITENGRHEVVRKYFVDFEAQAEDRLFEPMP